MGLPWIVPQLPGQPRGLPELLSVLFSPPGMCFCVHIPREEFPHVGTPGRFPMDALQNPQ